MRVGGLMKQYRRFTRKQRRKLPEMTPLGLLCLCFLCAVFLGAIFGASANVQTKQSVLSLLECAEEMAVPTVSSILWKYGKYAFVFWIAYPFRYGIFIAGAVFLFRGVCLGYTSAILIACSGFTGVSTILSLYFWQNIFLISAYMIPIYCLWTKCLVTTSRGRRFATSNKARVVSGIPMASFCVISILLLGIGILIEYMVVSGLQ